MVELQGIAGEILGDGKRRQSEGAGEVVMQNAGEIEGNRYLGNELEVYCNSLMGSSNSIGGFEGVWGLDNMFTGVPGWLESYEEIS